MAVILRHIARKALITVLPMAVMLGGCDTDDGQGASVTLTVQHQVDGTELTFDTLSYLNAADNLYSVTRLQYYLHGIRLIGASGQADHDVAAPILVDGRLPLDFTLDDVPLGSYSGIAMTIGILPEQNCTGCLPATTPNMQMAWPDPMGGGYHFMKFEGYFRANGGTGAQHGFAIHLGDNGAQGLCDMEGAFTVGETGGTLQLSFNLNEVFRSPNGYDMDTLTYTMGNMPVMMLVAENLSNAFTFNYVP